MNKGKNTSGRKGAATQKPKAPKNRKTPKSPGTEFDFVRDSYLATLADPFAVHGIRIPDAVTHPSGTMTLRYRTTVNAVQDGVTGNYAASAAFFPTMASGIRVISTYNSGTTSIGFGSASSFPEYTTASLLMRRYRVVSAGLAVVATTAMAQNQGRNLCAFYPGSDDSAPVFTTAITTNNLLVAEIMEDKPINHQQVCSIKWSPTDSSNSEYHNPDSYSNAANDATTYNPGILVWASNGISATASFEVLFTLNIEYLPKSNAMSIVPILPSLYSARAMERALNSSIVARVFGGIPDMDVFATVSTNDLGLSSFVSSALSNFGSGAGEVMARASYQIGRSLAHAGLTYAASHVRRQSTARRSYSALLGHPL